MVHYTIATKEDANGPLLTSYKERSKMVRCAIATGEKANDLFTTEEEASDPLFSSYTRRGE